MMPATPLRMVRTAWGLSAHELARLADLDRVTIHRLERSEVTPRKRTVKNLAMVLGCPAELLFPDGAHDQKAAGIRALRASGHGEMAEMMEKLDQSTPAVPDLRPVVDDEVEVPTVSAKHF